MKPHPTFTIVTPSYNQGSFLAETIESVLGQAGEFHIDYLIMDGGSTDDSVEIIRRYQRLLEEGAWPVACRGIRYRWASEPDRGQSDAIAKGFALAQGELLAWLNSDDLYLPGALEHAAQAFAAEPEAGLVYGEAHYCGPGGEIIGRYRSEPFDAGRLASFNFVCQPSAFFRRDAFAAVGGLDQSLHFAMDYDLWVRLSKSFPCRHIPLLLSRYRLHENSKTVLDRTLVRNAEEALQVALKHYRWAPLTRVYNACRARCIAALPAPLRSSRLAVAGLALLCTMLRSLWLNRGVRSADLRLLNRANFAKLRRSRMEIMTGTPRGGKGSRI